MRYFKDNNDNIHGVEEDQEFLIQSEWKEITKNEMEQLTAVTDDEIVRRMRSQRNELLFLSDWTQTSDSPVNKSDWAVYRQQLRDIPEQPGFPHEIDWPIKPE